MILNVRGTNGSGKTYLGYALIEKLHGQPILGSKGKPEAYRCKDDIILVGRYETACGGIDALPKPKGINSMEVVEDYVLKYAALGHVFFEGIIVSTLKQRWLDFAKRIAPLPIVFATLDTPMEVCYERVLARNGGKPVRRIELGLENTKLGINMKSSQTSHRAFGLAGLDARIMHYERAVEEALEILHDEKLRAFGYSRVRRSPLNE